MTVKSRAAKRGRHSVAVACALAAAMAAFAAGETQGQSFTLDQLLRTGSVDAADFPQVLGARSLSARFQEKRSFAMADGSRQTVFIFRVPNCWLKEGTAAARAVIDCRGRIGPGVFIPVLFVTPTSRQRPERSPVPDLVLWSRYGNSLADYVPEEWLDARYGPARVTWVRLRDPASDSLALSAPAAPAALVLCVPVSISECRNSGNVMLANLADTPDQSGAAPPPPPVVNPPPVTPPGPGLPPRTATPGPAAPGPAAPGPAAPPPPAPPGSGSVARATPAHSPTPAPSPPPPPPATESPLPAAVPGTAPAQLHYVIRPAAGSLPPDWNAARMAKRLVALLASTDSKFYLKARDSDEVPSSFPPELTGSGDAVVAWSGDNPPGSTEFIFRGVEGLELLPWTQPAESQPTSSSLASPRIRASDYISFAEYRIAPPFLYDQWQAGIEVVTRVYGREQPYAFGDACRFSLMIPRTGWISFLTGPVTVGLERTDQGGRTVLLSPPSIMPAQLMRTQGEPLLLDVQPANSGQGCITDRVGLSSFPTTVGNQSVGWKLSSVSGNPSTGRMDMLTAGVAVPGRWLLGLYGPQNIGAGTEAGPRAHLQDQIVETLTAFLDDFRERHFHNAQSASAAVGADLALVSAAAAASPKFSEEDVITGKFRQPPPNGLFRLDPEGSRRLSAFLSGPCNTGAEVSFRSVGQMIRHYSNLFGNFSGPRPPIAIYVGAARPDPWTCREWKIMTAATARLPGKPRVFAIVFADATADEIVNQFGPYGYGGEEILGGQTRALTCDGDSGSTLMVVPSPDLMLRTPDAILRPAFELVELRTTKMQN